MLPQFLHPDRQSDVMAAAQTVSTAAQQQAESNKQLARESPAHNIPIKSEYVPVNLQVEPLHDAENADDMTVMSSAEHFCEYGVDGHHLTYFRGNQNVPRLNLPRDFLASVEALPWIGKELEESRRRTRKYTAAEGTSWKMTLNHYPPSTDMPGQQRSGFPWHRDLEANGAATMILALGSPGRLAFGVEEGVDTAAPPPADNRVLHPERVTVIQELELEPLDMLLLTGQARWHYVHKVLPSTSGDRRVSIVLGVW